MRHPHGTRWILALALVLPPYAALAATSHSDAANEVAAAGKTLDEFVSDLDMTWFRENA